MNGIGIERIRVTKKVMKATNVSRILKVGCCVVSIKAMALLLPNVIFNIYIKSLEGNYHFYQLSTAISNEKILSRYYQGLSVHSPR